MEREIDMVQRENKILREENKLLRTEFLKKTKELEPNSLTEVLEL